MKAPDEIIGEDGEMQALTTPLTFRQLQDEVGEWSEGNFGAQDPINPLLGVIEEVGEICANKTTLMFTFHNTEATDGVWTLMRMGSLLGLVAHCILKRRQGIRGTPEELIRDEVEVLGVLARQAQNRRQALYNALATESPVTKARQDAVTEDIDWTALDAIQRAEEQDGIADIDIYLSDYCHRNHHDRQEIVEDVWQSVKERDWKKNPETGKETR